MELAIDIFVGKAKPTAKILGARLGDGQSHGNSFFSHNL